METFMRTVILSIPKASLLEAGINSHDVKQLTPLLTELRQQTFYHLLYREGGEWKERKRIDLIPRSSWSVPCHSRATTAFCAPRARSAATPRKSTATC